jgi:myosin-1
MTVVGMTAQEQYNVLYIVAGILHLGNLTFVEDSKKGNAMIADPNVLQIAANMLQVDAATLQNALLFRIIQTGGGGATNRSSTYNVPQNPEQAASARDALSKEIYSRLFDWIVEKVNIALQKYKLPFKNVIGILDIYGFVSFYLVMCIYLIQGNFPTQRI